MNCNIDTKSVVKTKNPLEKKKKKVIKKSKPAARQPVLFPPASFANKLFGQYDSDPDLPTTTKRSHAPSMDKFLGKPYLVNDIFTDLPPARQVILEGMSRPGSYNPRGLEHEYMTPNDPNVLTPHEPSSSAGSVINNHYPLQSNSSMDKLPLPNNGRNNLASPQLTRRINAVKEPTRQLSQFVPSGLYKEDSLVNNWMESEGGMLTAVDVD